MCSAKSGRSEFNLVQQQFMQKTNLLNRCWTWPWIISESCWTSHSDSPYYVRYPNLAIYYCLTMASGHYLPILYHIHLLTSLPPLHPLLSSRHSIIAQTNRQVLLCIIRSLTLCLVLGSPVPRLKKDWDWTGPRLPKTGNSQDRWRPQPRSSLQSFMISEI